MKIIENKEENRKYYFNALTNERYDESEVKILMEKFNYK